MTSAIQKLALDKLKGQWSLEGSLGDFFSRFEGVDISDLEESEKPSPCVTTPLIEPIEMTRAEADALRGWFKENGLVEQSPFSVEVILSGEFSVREAGSNIVIRLGEFDDFDPDRDVEHLPKSCGDIQKYHINLYRDDYMRLQLEFLREGWFSRENGERQGPTEPLPSPQP